MNIHTSTITGIGTATTYAIGDNIGGLLKITDVAGQKRGTVELSEIMLINRNGIVANDYTLFFFDDYPEDSDALLIDDSAFDIHANDFNKLASVVEIASADHTLVETNLSVGYVTELCRHIVCRDKSLYLAVRADDSTTITSPLVLKLTMSIDSARPRNTNWG